MLPRNGIMGSTSTEAKVFTPNGTVTRATVFQTLYNMEGQPDSAEMPGRGWRRPWCPLMET